MNMQPQTETMIEMERPQPRRRKRSLGLRMSVAAFAVAAAALTLRYALPRPVDGVVVAPATLSVGLTGPGTLEAFNRIAVSARVPGRLLEVNADINDEVVRGDVLARLDSQDLAEQRAAAEAAAQAALQAVYMAQSGRDRARAALARARATRDRQAALVKNGVASEEAFSSADAAFEQAKADLAHADRAIGQAEAQARSAAANVDVIEAQLGDTVIRAPFSGVVIARDGNPGDVVAAGTAILELVDPRSIVLTARFDESAMAGMRPGLPVEVSFTSQPRKVLGGRVLRLGRSVDVETREFVVDVTLDELPVNWAIGQRGLATVRLDRLEGVLAVPQSYVARRDGQLGLWTAEDGRARWRPVVLGAEGGDFVQVKSGIEAGDVVLAPANVFPRMRVVPRTGRP